MSLGTWFAGHGWRIAAVGALLATSGDCGQLWTVNAARPYLQLPVPPPWLILPATLAGALGIPLYGIGYYVRARGARRVAPVASALVMLAGAAFATLGGAVHAATGLAITKDMGGMASGLDPMQGILASGPIMLSLWGLAAGAFLTAGVAELCLPQPRRARLANPLVLTVFIAIAAPLVGPPWQDFVGPASVNIAHIVFFARLGTTNLLAPPRLGTA